MSSPEPDASSTDPTPVFAALGDPTRLELLARLGDGRPHSIAKLSEGLSLTRQGVTKHLRVLEQAGLVRSERSGRENRFTCVPESIDHARSYLDAVSAQWDAALARLRALVES